jgi:hypothetical protein
MWDIILYAVVGSALWRLWDHTELSWLWWTLVVLLVLELLVSQTIVRVARGREASVQDGAAQTDWLLRVAPFKIALRLLAVGAGAYAHYLLWTRIYSAA